MIRIAVTSCSKIADYEASVRRAGGEPVILRPSGNAEAAADATDALQGCDGLLLTGGGDVLPSLYGEEPHATFKAAERGRDEFEMALANQAIAADIPLLAVCRGVQVLNVARGGSLVQDIPSQVPSAVPHKVSDPPTSIAHDVRVETGSLLHRLMTERPDTHTPAASPGPSCPVNSRHHQAIERVGKGLVVTATAPDGVIEAVEDPTRRFCLGVQWHPENFWRTGEFSALFDGFIRACRRG